MSSSAAKQMTIDLYNIPTPSEEAAKAVIDASDMLLEQSNEIERLRADLALWKTEAERSGTMLQKLSAHIDMGTIDALQAEIGRLRAEADGLSRSLNASVAELDEGIADNAKLRAALLPYAEEIIESEDRGETARAAIANA